MTPPPRSHGSYRPLAGYGFPRDSIPLICTIDACRESRRRATTVFEDRPEPREPSGGRCRRRDATVRGPSSGDAWRRIAAIRNLTGATVSNRENGGAPQRGRAPMSQRRTAVPRPAATNRRPVTITRSRTRFPRYAPITKSRTKVTRIATIVASRKSRNANGMIGRRAARSGAIPWTSALRIAENWNASLCSSLRRASIARSIVRMSSFFSTRSASYAPTALLTARAIAAPMEAERISGLCASDAPTAYAPMMIPRTVRAPSNAPITKYRRIMGPTFVISSYSRIRRRQAPRSMSSARDPKLLADAPFEPFGCGSGLIEIRKTRLREVGLSPAFAAEFRRDGLEDPGDVHGDIGAARDDEAAVMRRLGPEDRGRPSLGSDRLRHGHHEADAFPHLLLHERPGGARRLDGLSGLRRRLLLRRTLGKLPELLPFGDDTLRGWDELVRGNPEDFRRAPNFVELFPDRIERRLPRGVFETHDSILDARGPEDLDEGDIARSSDVRPATRLRVPLRDLHDAQLPARHGAPLVESEAELPLREIAGQELSADLSGREHLIVRHPLDLRELRVRQGIEVGDVEAGHVDRLVCARLPRVVPEEFAGRAEDDVRGSVIPHQRLAAVRVDRAGHSLALEATRVPADEMQDGRSGPLDIVDFEFVDRAVVGFLTAAFRVEERLVQDHGLAFHSKDFRSEGTPAPVFVHAKLRRRELLRNCGSFRRLGHGAFVPRRDTRVKVIRDFNWQVREFLDDIRIESVAVVQLEKCLEVEALARGRQVGRNLRDRGPPLLERLLVPGLFDLQELQDVPCVEEEFRIVLPDLIDHEGHGVREAVRDVEILQGPESSPDEEAREIALPAVRRDDAVPEEEDQGSRMVADCV